MPVMGYRDGKYDVYRAKVETYNAGTANEYNSLQNNFASVKNSGSSATFQFDNYEDAKVVYNQILNVYEASKSGIKGTHTLEYKDMEDHGLT